jgi:hypothetical protein
VAWIGYGIQETLSKDRITLLSDVDPGLLQNGSCCLAVYPATGMWYECVVESKLNEAESEQFASTDMR